MLASVHIRNVEGRRYYVDLADIPQPWREHFWAALYGAQLPVIEGVERAAYARAIEGADLILMLSTMLHSIGVGNMTPAGVKLVCVDINPAVVTKLTDRGSIESVGIVTDVGLFLRLLAGRLGLV